jgi:hypothetical protein
MAFGICRLPSNALYIILIGSKLYLVIGLTTCTVNLKSSAITLQSHNSYLKQIIHTYDSLHTFKCYVKTETQHLKILPKVKVHLDMT